MSVSQATTERVAGKMVSAHNGRTCKHCQRPWPEGGVLAFGTSGSDARWYPTEQEAEAGTPGVRIIFPVHDQDIDTSQVIAWLEDQRERLDNMIDDLECRREQRRIERQMRADERGFRSGPCRCDSCGHRKDAPASRCDYCGDDPLPVGYDPHAFNRDYGYRS